jgi:amidophosphoribosyltransferase
VASNKIYLENKKLRSMLLCKESGLSPARLAMQYTGNNHEDKPRHYCGIAGIGSPFEINLPEKLFYPLFALQHRGQESAGISYNNKGELIFYKDLGMVTQVLSHYLKENHPSKVGIGHVRYSTQGANKLENAQPITITCNKGQIALAHNGNTSNSEVLRDRLFKEGSIFQSTSDTELILHLIARSPSLSFQDALIQTLKDIEGAYSMLLLHENTLYAVRDPFGFRPLVLGKAPEMIVFASETCALDTMGIKEYQEINPGEMVILQGDSLSVTQFSPCLKKSYCIFELIYFSRPDSIVFGYPVHALRKKMGAALARIDDHPGDIVIAVPDSGNSAALGYAAQSGITLEHGLTRDHYSGRTFIQPLPKLRELGVRMKLHPIKDVIAGKKITLIDDSIVRGTTSSIIVRLLREAGAKEIHLRLSSPEIKFPCFFGIDIPTKEELISNRMSPGEIAELVNADSVSFLPLPDLRNCVSNPDDFCYACFNGQYPFPVKDPAIRRKD